MLEALNDFLVEPGGGFGPHSHEETEIISYCVEGELRHSDSQGAEQLLRRGDVGYQCAGSGIIHTEENHSPDAQLHFVQTLIKPNAPNLTPSYSSLRISAHDRRNKWLQIVSGRPINDTIQINQDAAVFVSEVIRERGSPSLYQAGAKSIWSALRGALQLPASRSREAPQSERSGRPNSALMRYRMPICCWLKWPKGCRGMGSQGGLS